jgi:uncharacterized protein YjbI with pentapeptide repeats
MCRDWRLSVVRVNRARPLVHYETDKEKGREWEFDLVPVIDFLLRPVVPGVIAVALIGVSAWLLSTASVAVSNSAFLGASLLSGSIVALAITWLEWSRDAAAAAKNEAERQLKEKRDRQFELGLRRDFRGWTLPPGEDLSDIKLPYRDFSGAKLRQVILNGADLKEGKFIRSDLIMSEMRLAELYRANFSGAWLGGVHFEKADLMRAVFDGADLINAHLDNAQIQNASFKGTTLREAVFSGVDITGLDFSESKGLEEASLNGALVILYKKGEKVDTAVKFPADFDWQGRGLKVLDLNQLPDRAE